MDKNPKKLKYNLTIAVLLINFSYVKCKERL